MHEEDLLYAALASSLGLVVRADPTRLRKAKARLAKSDAALLGLDILGPDRSGRCWLIRTYEAKKVLDDDRT